MNKDFETKIKPILTYVGAIGAVLTSIAYVLLILVLINGFKIEQGPQVLTFAIVNGAVGLIIANLLKYQGLSFAKNLPENEEVVKAYYSTKTKDKKNHGLGYFWTTSLIKDILFKGCTITASTCGVLYIVIVGCGDWNLMLMAIVNLILFTCFGLLALNKAYDYYNNVFVNYMKEKLDETKTKTDVELVEKKSDQQRDDTLHTDRGSDILDPSVDSHYTGNSDFPVVVDGSKRSDNILGGTSYTCSTSSNSSNISDKKII